YQLRLLRGRAAHKLLDAAEPPRRFVRRRCGVRDHRRQPVLRQLHPRGGGLRLNPGAIATPCPIRPSADTHSAEGCRFPEVIEKKGGPCPEGPIARNLPLMEPSRTGSLSEADRIRRAAAGDRQAWSDLLADHRARLRRMVALRL